MSADESNQGFVLKREIDVGQILTVLSIIGSLIGFGYAWNNDRSLKDKEYADRVRRSASVVTAKVERWAELSDRYFEDLQPVLVEVSEKVAETHARQPTNRILFKGLMDSQSRASQRIVDEQLQLAYMELYGYVPSFQSVFDTTISEIKAAEKKAHENLSSSLQDVLVDQSVLELQDSPQIGNELRRKVEEERARLHARITELSNPLRAKMLSVIELKDSDLRDAHEKPELSVLIGSATKR